MIKEDIEKNAPINEEPIDFKKIIFLIRKKWQWLLVGCAVGLLVGLFVVLISVPEYKVSGSLINMPSGGASNNGEGLLLSMTANSEFLNTQQQLLQSRVVLKSIIEKYQMNLTVKPLQFPLIGRFYSHFYNKYDQKNKPSAPVLGLSSYSWGGDQLTFAIFKVSRGLMGKEFILQYLGGDKFNLENSDGEVLLQGVIGEEYDKVVNKYENIQVEVSNIEARSKVRFSVSLRSSFPTTSSLRGKIQFSESRAKDNILNLSLKTLNPDKGARLLNSIMDKAIELNKELNVKRAEQTLEFLQKQLPGVKESLESAQNDLSVYQAQSEDIILGQPGKFLIAKISNIHEKISSLQMRRAELLGQYKESSYQIKSLDNLLSQLSKEKQQLITQVHTLPKEQQGLLNLGENVEANQKIYSNLLNEIQTYELLKAGTLSQMLVLDYAESYPVLASQPGRVTLIICLFVGLMGSLIFIVAIELLKDTIDSPDVIEKLTGLPLLGSLWESSKVKESEKRFDSGELSYLPMLDELDHFDTTLESLRGTMTAMNLSLIGDKKIIGISGPTPNVGKSFVSANLANVFAINGKKVLLVDADLRRGILHNYFASENKSGWIDLLMNQVDIPQAIQNTRFENLDFISTGNKHVKNYLSTLSSEHAYNIFERLKSMYDVVVIDTPPILSTSDAGEIFQLTDVNLMVFCFQQHNSKSIVASIKQMKNFNVNIDGFLFNRIEETGDGYYGCKYEYRYDAREK